MDLTQFQFDLPERLIALRPAEPQDSARLLVVHGDGRLEDAGVRDLPRYLNAGDVLVFNDTRVLPAALKGVRPARDETGQDVACDVNLTERIDGCNWRALARPGRRLKDGDTIVFAEGFTAEITGHHEGGEIGLRFSLEGDALTAALDRHGAMPLPPYIARRRPADAKDRETYQTKFAGEDAASVAAPTAGLHFTPRLLSECDAAGLVRETVRLHVGLGTFKPLEEKQLEENRLHEEWRRLTPETAARLNAARASGHRVVPVGTTAMRTLESCVDADGVLHPATGPTDIFLKPGDAVQGTDALVTNFHLPGSSLFMLVSALMGTDVMRAAYAHAIANEYRFYSYGDACLLLP
ncbi:MULTISPECIES: tRNA preQ1(34) S-adenosylmethionine ribosyltransferase-isomerase QueA [unclassified Hyphomonas]|jgi:S-adenosylmethionine:tRNA ribosyltransferase-isomerase|uniref:tRNA preQ1(34) S-adenosylmethionine ribosyltransferase-isomerase QueA n=1 Tax=unclassified Hyphomonas TaxID=2630699 RepID=UPI000458B441|nr:MULTISPECIES: tRNA preQ1(34) S-adenosylmethionine ribosyltransferase-isomerase QueA [unclassified Hyphomonas]KCZ47622.1 S-adenosylmethionine tRNA ribosyltransferase [Hyphomonas sp. CY54-11-8]RAN39511.1 S-adenosylmethionine tRNA ribosyltransferase [Hyphomonas sp. GM-8P]